MDLNALEGRARSALDQAAYDFIAGGADDERTLADNVAAWQRLRLRPHVLRDVSAVSCQTTVLGTPVSMPVLVGPTAFHRLTHPEGECATARAAAAAGTVMTVSTMATISLEEVAAAAAGAPRWFQIYVFTDRGLSAGLVERAVTAGYEALVLTVDVVVAGNRRRDERNGFALPEGLRPANVDLGPVVPDPYRVPGSGGSELASFVAGSFDPAVTLDDIAWLSELSGLPVLIKGVLRGDDAQRCIEAGAAGIIVSNHGGRQLDTAIATAEALPEVVASAGPDVEVYVDGGIRRGTDIVKALALGARGVLIGRPVMWGLATGGSQGVQDVLDGFRAELALALALCGCPSVADLTLDLVKHGL
ncbi:MAG: alpha-hydroxy-acid oxidizing protein [Nitriliruptorales bacterium]|nr:alpha-hydroxy-acid oxidizing protein [Nitriliruptorales bacterium]